MIISAIRKQLKFDTPDGSVEIVCNFRRNWKLLDLQGVLLHLSFLSFLQHASRPEHVPRHQQAENGSTISVVVLHNPALAPPHSRTCPTLVQAVGFQDGSCFVQAIHLSRSSTTQISPPVGVSTYPAARRMLPRSFMIF